MAPARTARLVSLAGLTVLATCLPAGPALAQEESRQTASVEFAEQRPGVPTGLTISIAYRNPDDPEGKPFAVAKVVTVLAPGTRVDTSVPALCTASDEELSAQGAGACPGQSVVGGGAASVDTGAAVAETDVTLLNNEDELIFLVEPRDMPSARMVLRSQVEGRTITNEVPPVPGGPPDGFAAIRDAELRIDRVVERAGGRLRAYVATPPSCPAASAFQSSVEFTYRDGVEQTVESASPCVALDRRPPRVALLGVRRRGCVRGALRVRVRVRDRSPLRSVRVRLNSRPLFASKRKRFAVRIPARRLRPGTNRLVVVAKDRSANRFRLTRKFTRCR